MLMIAKGCMPLSSMESPWMRRTLLSCDPKLFLSRKALVNEHIPAMLKKIMEQYMLPRLSTCATVNITFDLWMSRTGCNTFAMVAHFIDNVWVPCHVILGLFEEKSTAGARLAEIVKLLLDKYKLLKKVICCIKEPI